MGHTWRAEIIRSDGGALTFADGDDVAVTVGVRLTAEPQVALELNRPSKAVLEIKTSAEAARNVRSASFARWSTGPAGAIKRGMHVRVWQTDAASGAEIQTFQGRVWSVDRAEDRAIIIAYDDLMELAELKEPTMFFSNFRDMIGGEANGGNGPYFPIGTDSGGRITATLPDADIVQPLVRVTLSEPQDTLDGISIPERGWHVLQPGVGIIFNLDRPTSLSRVRMRLMKNYNAGNIAVTVQLRNTVSSNYGGVAHYNPGSTLYNSWDVDIPAQQGDKVVWESAPFHRLLQPGLYAITVTGDDRTLLGVHNLVSHPLIHSEISHDGTDWLLVLAYARDYNLSISFQSLVDREIDPKACRLSGSALTVDQGESTLTTAHLDSFKGYLHVSYFYGRLAPEEIMERIVEAAGMTAARAGSLGQGAATIGYYHTSTASYLDCLRELADLYDPTIGQWTISADRGAIGTKAIRFGRRRRPWAEAIDSHTFAEGPFSAGQRRVLQSQLHEVSEAKVGTARVIGAAFDGSPITAQVDDRLWGADSLVTQLGADLTDYTVDPSISTVEQAARVAEALIREAHQGTLEGSLTLSGRWPSVWDLDAASAGGGGSGVIGVTSERDGLSARPAIARRIEIGRDTKLDLDNVRQPDRSMIKRSMDKAFAGEAFNVSSMPDTVYVHARVDNMPAGVFSSGIAWVALRRSDGALAPRYWWGGSWQTGIPSTIRSDDNCAPDGRGYSHFAAYSPPGAVAAPSSYSYSGGTTALYQYNAVVVRYGSTELAIPIRPVWIWSHQAVLVDVYGRRPA